MSSISSSIKDVEVKVEFKVDADVDVDVDEDGSSLFRNLGPTRSRFFNSFSC